MYENEAIQLKLDSYSNSRYVLDHIIDIQKKKEDDTCMDIRSVLHLLETIIPQCLIRKVSLTVSLQFHWTLDLEEFAAGIGFKKEVSSDPDLLADAKVSTTNKIRIIQVIVDDASHC
ncbi:hypothetical protein Hanom_Chr02g00107361 [Helianthus anomalus]